MNLGIPTPSGALLTDKPVGLTSQDVVTKIKWAFINEGYAPRGFKIGHGGTLDPFASGVLSVLFGEATKLADCYLHSNKAYSGIIQLGKKTDTGDLTGICTGEASVPTIADKEWNQFASRFTTTEYVQVPPMYSAKKQNGKALYELARAGIEVERNPILKRINSFQVKLRSVNELQFHTECESGTYIRVLAEDLAKAAGTLAHLTELRRTRSSDLKIENADSLDMILKQVQAKLPLESFRNFIPLSNVASHIFSLDIDQEMTHGMRLGQKRAIDPLLEKMKEKGGNSRYGIARLNQSPIALFEKPKDSEHFRLQRILN